MKSIFLTLCALVILQTTSASAQESGPLMMKVEIGFTLAGFVGGAALGAIVWLTDPGNPGSPLILNLKNGMVLGSFIGAAFGYYVLYTSARVPHSPLNFPQDDLNNLLGASDAKRPSIFARSPSDLSINLLNIRF